jgi:hypothetical protein
VVSLGRPPRARMQMDAGRRARRRRATDARKQGSRGSWPRDMVRRPRKAGLRRPRGRPARVSGCAIGGAGGYGAGEGIGWEEEEAGERRRGAAAAEREWMEWGSPRI